MAKYVDGFVLPVPKKNLAKYRQMAKEGAKIWKKYGALEYVEAVGDDMSPKMMGAKFVKFPQLAKAKANEVVVFSFIVFKSKAHRDAVNAKVMKDPSMDNNMTIPFDVKRMAYGGFKTLVDL